MFFYKNKFIKIKKNYILKNLFSWFDYFLIWQYCFLNLFFDEIFSNFIKKIFKLFFIIPGFFFFDKYFSYWISYNFFKKNFFFLSNIFFINKINNIQFIKFLIIFLFYFFIIFLIFLFL